MTKEELINKFGLEAHHFSKLELMVFAYNLALDHAAENATARVDGLYEPVDKESILNLKITE